MDDIQSLAKEIRAHSRHQWSNHTYVQSDKVRAMMVRAADVLDSLRKALTDISVMIEDNRDKWPEDPPCFKDSGIATSESEAIADIIRALEQAP